MNVLSLFDGISGGRLALERAEIPVTKYFASEIDKHAIQISEKHWPDIERLGDANHWRNWYLPKDIDLVIGGAPCQSWSVAGSAQGSDDPRGKLFLTMIDIIRATKPKYFLIENVKMKNEFKHKLSEMVGVVPILIDSSLVSAQRRLRYYWTNIPVEQPKDKGITLQSILEHNDIPACFSSSGRGNGVIERRMSENTKAHTLTATGYTKRSFSGAITDQLKIRKLSVTEMERLQTYPEGYTEGLSVNQATKVLGNSFTVNVITHILKSIGL